MNKKIAIGGPNPLSDEIKSKPSTKIKQQEEYHQLASRWNQEEGDSNSEDQNLDKQFKSLERPRRHYQPIQFEEFTLEKKPPQLTLPKKKPFQIEVPDMEFDQNSSVVKKDIIPQKNMVFEDYISKEPIKQLKKSAKVKMLTFNTEPATSQDYVEKDYPSLYFSNLSQKQTQEPKLKQQPNFSQQREYFKKQLQIKDAQLKLMEKLIVQQINVNHPFDRYLDIEKILIEKDSSCNDILQKLELMSQTIKKKNQQIQDLRRSNNRIQNELELTEEKVDLFIRKKQNAKSPKRFSQLSHQNGISIKTDGEQVGRSARKEEEYTKNMAHLKRRLDLLNSHKVELRTHLGREKSKSMGPKQEVHWISMTTKHQPKGAFDFNFDRENGNLRAEFHTKDKRYNFK